MNVQITSSYWTFQVTYVNLSMSSTLEKNTLYTMSSSSVTISRPSSSSLKITNRLFRFISPYLWNQLPVSFRQSSNQSPSHSPHFTHGSSCTSSSFLPSLIHSLFHSRLKTYPFSQVFPTIDFYGTLPPDCLLGLRLLSELIMLIVLFYFFVIISF